jgi:hypothetical protein
VALRDASELLYPAVAATVASLGIDTADGGKDAGMAKLALGLAKAIDRAEGKEHVSALWHLGAELRATLESLGGSPAARAAIKTAKPADAKPNGLQALREARGA